MTRVEELFWEGAAGGRLVLARCAKCSLVQHPPSPMCPRCGSVEWEPQAATGRGTIHSWIVSHHPSEPDDEARIVILVELDEGVRLVSNLVGTDPGEVNNDLAVIADFAEVDGIALPQFRLASGP